MRFAAHDFEHIVGLRVNHSIVYRRRPFGQFLDHCFRHGKVEHISGLYIRYVLENSHEFGQ